MSTPAYGILHTEAKVRELIHNGRYRIPLSAYEYTVMIAPSNTQNIAYILVAPPDTTYPDAPHLYITDNGHLHSNEGRLDYTIDDLEYSGRTHDHATNLATKLDPHA